MTKVTTSELEAAFNAVVTNCTDELEVEPLAEWDAVWNTWCHRLKDLVLEKLRDAGVDPVEVSR